MFDKIKSFDIGTFVLSGFAFWLFFLYAPLMVMWPFAILKEYLDGKDIFRQIYPYGIIVIIVSLIIFFFVLAGVRWSWTRTTFFIIEKNGEWVCRNSIYYAIHRIPPHVPRRLETVFNRSKDENGSGYIFSGLFYILQNTDPSIHMEGSADQLPNGESDFFHKLGFPDELVLSTGPNGGTTTDWYTWSSTGPVFLSHAKACESKPMQTAD